MKVLLPYISALKLLEVAPSQVEQYLSKHMDDYFLNHRLNRWQFGRYANKWLTSDSIPMQVQTNAGQLQIDVVDCHGTVYITELMIQRQQNRYDPTTYIYESSTALEPLPQGIYWFKFTNDNVALISEPIEVVNTLTESLLLQYKHRKYYEGVIWETGFESNMRVPGVLRYKPPAAKDTVYEDQVLDMTMIKSVPYRLIEILAGAGDMVPDYFIDTLNRIFGCSSLRIDGRYYSKNEGFKWEAADEVYNGVLYSYRGELREMLNRPYKLVEPGTDQNAITTIMGMVDLKGFADTSESASSNLTQFEDIE